MEVVCSFFEFALSRNKTKICPFKGVTDQQKWRVRCCAPWRWRAIRWEPSTSARWHRCWGGTAVGPAHPRSSLQEVNRKLRECEMMITECSDSEDVVNQLENVYFNFHHYLPERFSVKISNVKIWRNWSRDQEIMVQIEYNLLFWNWRLQENKNLSIPVFIDEIEHIAERGDDAHQSGTSVVCLFGTQHVYEQFCLNKKNRHCVSESPSLTNLSATSTAMGMISSINFSSNSSITLTMSSTCKHTKTSKLKRPMTIWECSKYSNELWYAFILLT